MQVDGSRRGSGRLARAVRRLGCVHEFDILGRSTAGPAAEGSQGGFVLERVTAMGGPLQDAEGEHQSRLLELVNRIGPLRRALLSRRARRQAARFACGDVAYVALHGPKVAAWAWVSQQPEVRCTWSGLRFRLLPGEAYLYDLWCFPEYRRSGAGVVVMRGLLRELHDRGDAERAYGYVLQDNRASQVLHRLVLGFEQVQVVRSFRLLSHWAWQLRDSGQPGQGPCSRGGRRGGRPAAAIRRGRAA
ncbi:MAG: hypothetical protein JWP14_3205 [Frankiales bacterium]|nr:hypothetical protein [Frankiales bacterium]